MIGEGIGFGRCTAPGTGHDVGDRAPGRWDDGGTVGALTLYGRSSIANVEIGRQHVARDFWASCDAALGTSGALTQAFADFERARIADLSGPLTVAVTEPRDGGQPEKVWTDRDSRQELAALAALAVGVFPENLSMDALEDLLAAPVRPDSVTELHVETIRQVTDVHRVMQYRSGGYGCLASASSYILWAQGLLGCQPATPSVRIGLLSALAELHNIVGWAQHDVGANDHARRHFTRSCFLAAHAGDPATLADGYYRLGRVELQRRPEEALKLFQLGQLVAESGGLLASLSILHANEAWAYAYLGEPERVLDSLARARNELDRVHPDQIPVCARFIAQPADLDGLSAVVFTTLARHPEYRRYAGDALEHAHRAIAARGAGEERSHVFDLVSVASAHLLQGDVPAAHHAAHRAIDAAAPIGSTRVVDRLHEWWRLADVAGHGGTVQDVKERITSLAHAQ